MKHPRDGLHEWFLLNQTRLVKDDQQEHDNQCLDSHVDHQLHCIRNQTSFVKDEQVQEHENKCFV